MLQSARASIGCGLVGPLSGVHLELNLCAPIRQQPSDKTRHLQFGIGLGVNIL